MIEYFFYFILYLVACACVMRVLFNAPIIKELCVLLGLAILMAIAIYS